MNRQILEALDNEFAKVEKSELTFKSGAKAFGLGFAEGFLDYCTVVGVIVVTIGTVVSITNSLKK